MTNQRHSIAFLFTALVLLSSAISVRAAVGTTVPITSDLGNGIAASLFPVSVKLDFANLLLTEPVLIYMDAKRIGMQVRFQAYDHRPAQGVAISEMGSAMVSGELGYDQSTQQILMYGPKIEKLVFDRSSEVTQRWLPQLNKAWSTQVTNPIRSELPPHPYLTPFKQNIQGVSYDGSSINLTIVY